MASTNSQALDGLSNDKLLTLYQERWPAWAVPPVLSAEQLPDQERERLLLSLAAGEPVLEWQRRWGNVGRADSPTY